MMAGERADGYRLHHTLDTFQIVKFRRWVEGNCSWTAWAFEYLHTKILTVLYYNLCYLCYNLTAIDTQRRWMCSGHCEFVYFHVIDFRTSRIVYFPK